MIIMNFVSGPFKDEQEFKQAVLKKWRTGVLGYTYFELENEEKEPGMPDVLAISSFQAGFFEFKYADQDGVITFQKSQPLFYKQHEDIPIDIIAWDSRFGGRIVKLHPSEVINAKSLRIQLPESVREET
jgi:hypothetical protein